ncbi:serine acetyltransferase [Pedobacter frigidisoli]|uniref:Serine acetyltransferase n=1 Tax=Pedobacter frigidisoli TaxID=2530455 RepID=A0A4R0NPP5_9SPHI|nr:serine acetyltransferase [Pedobacter frigidisoli]TCD01978.1 serine acetyltransferase [Pedobacter frigidisoli]
MGFFRFIFQDWKANKQNLKGKIFLMLFRIANFFARNRSYYILGIPYLIFYKVFIQWIFTLEIPWTVTIGKNFSLYHGQLVIMNNDVVIGDNCTIRHCTTIGVKQNADGTSGRAPILGNNVDVGSNVCIIGAITINDNVKIGSGAVVVKDVDEDCIAVGNPAAAKKINHKMNMKVMVGMFSVAL